MLAATVDARDLALWALVVTAPFALVLIVALLRGYEISVHLTRRDRAAGSGRE
ncbi:MAG TPA: hypothetical protein VFE12_00115 [Acetobacteraceae bacterium]|nr:hypothetical protein [Acetobacteraceae bacterium]